MQRAKASSKWPATNGKIILSEVKKNRKTKSTNTGSHRRTKTVIEYKARIKYSYAANGKSLNGSRISFGGMTPNARSKAEQIVRKYPLGKDVKVYYSPENPSLSVLEPGVTSGNYFLLLFGGIFLIAGIATMFFKSNAVNVNFDNI